jgi:hypothetical protein
MYAGHLGAASVAGHMGAASVYLPEREGALDVATIAEVMADAAEISTHRLPTPLRPPNLSRAQVLVHALQRLVEVMMGEGRPGLNIDFRWAQLLQVPQCNACVLTQTNTSPPHRRIAPPSRSKSFP